MSARNRRMFFASAVILRQEGNRSGFFRPNFLAIAPFVPARGLASIQSERRSLSMPARNAITRYRNAAKIWFTVAVCFLGWFRPGYGAEKPQNAANLAEAICPVVYPLDETPSEKGYHYLFYGNAFFINEDGYLVTAAHLLYSFKDGGQPHVLVALPSGQRHLLKTDVVATDW